MFSIFRITHIDICKFFKLYYFIVFKLPNRQVFMFDIFQVFKMYNQLEKLLIRKTADFPSLQFYRQIDICI
ncbi:hypothetical protein D0T57_13360, partial [Dysgonomonas sp. 511]|nr:hypothetical protein [Dysgonomonas sp. 511]